MNDTRKKICEQAKILFNTKGYYHVSLRDIAQAAGTTIGNLTYHFHKKEDLILEIQKDAHNHLLYVLESRLNREGGYEHTLNEILESLYLTEKNEKEFSYYFQNLLELAMDFPEIQQEQRHVRSIMVQYYYEGLLFLKEKGIVRTDITAKDCHAAARSIVLLNTFWNQAESPAVTDPLFHEHGFADTCVHVLSAMLTERGKKQLNAFQLPQ